ncbi:MULTISPECIES: helix-turn-helix domain-containing protein [Paenibacillus]|jgi:transcriptional regulator with XRE-family HTH domain|uniref:Helix-turn-helix transcriptional regulator n=3 Tax=Paenibacillus TaxID=44249 RepID=A0A329QCY6_9BACL|nr:MULTISPECIES: helix-turn-helix transcriptional regulator [Paenibacillus]UOK64511.1 helix-turn-helix domain-containing protein [Paenibacillus sp. OVF10]ETT33148.1 transcriptional regulator y4dJ [Paenibacillus sp. FSL R5-192]ETT54931.1 transcriptional regulator y4dJ [Paenibacillus sp. FSL H7-689]MDN4604877.1 helix-turn-helix transcriptional regulator [Paenibacillus vandeheii]MDT9721020.1 helix-turn-helix transcriptional regulator [Paenibacillus sp. ClWae2A]
MNEDREVLKLVGARIRALRKERGYSQESLGEKGGFHFSYIGQIERGEKNVSLVNLAKIAESLDVNLIQLFAYIEEEFEVTEDEKQIKEIVQLLRDSSPDNIRVAKNVIKGILM